jgi:hypothetical protein
MPPPGTWRCKVIPPSVSYESRQPVAAGNRTCLERTFQAAVGLAAHSHVASALRSAGEPERMNPCVSTRSWKIPTRAVFLKIRPSRNWPKVSAARASSLPCWCGLSRSELRDYRRSQTLSRRTDGRSADANSLFEIELKCNPDVGKFDYVTFVFCHLPELPPGLGSRMSRRELPCCSQSG